MKTIEISLFRLNGKSCKIEFNALITFVQGASGEACLQDVPESTDLL